MLDTATLVDRCRGGDELAWEELVRRYQGRVYATALHYLRHADEARDAAQEAFVKVWTGLAGFRGERFLPWLLGLTRNCCIDRMRRSRARGARASVPLEDGPQLDSGAVPADEAVSRGQRARLLDRALGQLSDAHREVILLKEIQGLKIEEVAGLLGLPVGTVKSRSNRARLELARTLRATGAAPQEAR